MRTTRLLISTLREAPADAETASHRLMLRAGLIRQLAAGIYSWLPLGVRVLRRVERIVREEMLAAGAQEVLLPGVQPAELWQESGRWDKYGPELLRFTDRHDRAFCLGPTHEEVITDLARREIRSYRQLPATFFQIQTKFRDEVRPRFGVMRAREFIMKDAYSFHLDEASLDETYALMHDAYSRIFSRLGLDFRAVVADTGNIGGQASHEFHVLADAGEDRIAFSDASDFAANLEMVPVPPPDDPPCSPRESLERVPTPGLGSIEEVAAALGVPTQRCLKTLIVHGSEAPLVALVLRGDHELNAVKAARLEAVASPLGFASEAEIRDAIGCGPGSIGPLGLPIPLIADHAAAAVCDFVCGANEDGYHLRGVNWGRDLPAPRQADLRNAVAGDPSPDGRGRLRIARGIEVGHIFKLGTTYSEAMGATVLDAEGRARALVMGCYGIGVSRIVAAAIEQHHDERGIVWPAPLAPFDVAIAPINLHKSERLRQAVEALYRELTEAGFEVLLDDRRERPGVIFSDLELIGIPWRLVMSDRGLDAGTVEVVERASGDVQHVPREAVVATLRERLG